MFPLHDINRSHRRPYVVYALVVLNLLGFIYTFFLTDPAAVIQTYGFVPARFLADPGGEWITLFSSMFLHGSLMHILGNLWFLWVFGDNIEDRLGHGRFLGFYLLGGVAAAFAQGLVSGFSSDTP
ncbi:MAG: rhomboid family intramembrane serine protease, partial [Meiothermus sp.]|uniref:rhomboid family intramembrane serine protease n=1 Tax=Meiothermus sp. TaxID=1955249 RepID=UPI0025FAD7FF